MIKRSFLRNSSNTNTSSQSLSGATKRWNCIIAYDLCACYVFLLLLRIYELWTKSQRVDMCCCCKLETSATFIFILGKCGRILVFVPCLIQSLTAKEDGRKLITFCLRSSLTSVVAVPYIVELECSSVQLYSNSEWCKIVYLPYMFTWS